MSCEYRVMVDHDDKKMFRIGLNESQFGLKIAPWFIDTMKCIVHSRHAEMALISGTMFTAEDALKVPIKIFLCHEILVHL